MEHYFAHLQNKQRNRFIRKYKDKFLSLPLEQKLIGAGFLIALLGAFLPWANLPSVDGTAPIVYNGFQGVTYLIGYSVVFLSMASILAMVAGFFEIKKMEQFQRYVLPFQVFASMQIAFLSMVTYSIYGAFYQIKYSGSYTEYGIMITLVGGLVGGVGCWFAYNELRKVHRKKKTLHHLHDHEDEASRILEMYQEDRDYQSMNHPHPDQTSLIPEEQQQSTTYHS